MLTKVGNIYSTTWEIFSIKDQTVYDTDLEISEILSSSKVRDIALATGSYSVVDGKGYGYSNFLIGVTEQQAFDDWLRQWNKVVKETKQSLINWGIVKITQNRYDGLILLNWAQGQINTVQSSEGTYDIREAYLKNDWDTVASMINTSIVKRIQSVRAASVFRLADYGKPTNRRLMRTNGIHQMRQLNKIGNLDVNQLNRIRSAYYAEVKDFLPFTPESLKRDIVKKWKDTLVQKQFVFSGSNVFELASQPSIYPVEKLIVRLNGQLLQQFFDYTLENKALQVNKVMTQGDIIDTTIRI